MLYQDLIKKAQDYLLRKDKITLADNIQILEYYEQYPENCKKEIEKLKEINAILLSRIDNNDYITKNKLVPKYSEEEFQEDKLSYRNCAQHCYFNIKDQMGTILGMRNGKYTIKEILDFIRNIDSHIKMREFECKKPYNAENHLQSKKIVLDSISGYEESYDYEIIESYMNEFAKVDTLDISISNKCISILNGETLLMEIYFKVVYDREIVKGHGMDDYDTDFEYFYIDIIYREYNKLRKIFEYYKYQHYIFFPRYNPSFCCENDITNILLKCLILNQ